MAGAVAADCFHGVVTTGRREPAGRHPADAYELIQPEDRYQQPRHRSLRCLGRFRRGLVGGRRDLSALGRKVPSFDTDDLT